MAARTRDSDDNRIVVEDMFASISRDLNGTRGWSKVETSVPGAETHVRGVALGESVVRSRLEVDMPLEETLLMCRPEIAFHPRRVVLGGDTSLVGCGVAQVFSPGDALTWFQLRMTPIIRKAVVLTAAPDQSDEASPDKVCWMRVVLRRDFPLPSVHSIIYAPYNPETGEVLESRGMMRAKVVVLRQSALAPTKTVLTSIVTLSGVPVWAIQKCDDFNKMREDRLRELTGSDFWQEALDGSLGYVVVALKKCVRGPPLLPLDASACAHGSLRRTQGDGDYPDCASSPELFTWKPAESQGFSFPTYLRAFLGRVGVEADVFDCIDGRPLAPYQAALARSDWDRVWRTIEADWAAQRAAYRRLRGGTCAPVIMLCPEPRYGRGPPPVCLDLSDASQACVQVHRTFLHFGTRSPRARRFRARSSPVEKIFQAIVA